MYKPLNIWGLTTQPSLVMFDLDGTLVNTLQNLTLSVNFMRSQFDLPNLTTEDVRRCIGKGVRNLVTRVLPGCDNDIEKGLKIFLDHNENHLAVFTVLYPGVHKLLANLYDAKIKMAVVSNKNRALCLRLLETLAISNYFVEIIGGDSEMAQKPSPEPLLEAISRTASNRATTIMIGDSINDFQAAGSAGIRSIGCRFGFGEPPELLEADVCIDYFEQLLPLPW